MKPDRCSDRFIPSRAGARWHIDFNLITENGANQNMCNKNEEQNNHQQQQSAQSHPQESQVQQTNQQTRKRKDTNENGKGLHLLSFISITG